LKTASLNHDFKPAPDFLQVILTAAEFPVGSKVTAFHGNS
jgi:hypothetical protein